MLPEREIGVALVNRMDDGRIIYSMTDEFGHFVGEFIWITEDEYEITDKYGTRMPPVIPVYGWIIAGVFKYEDWAARH